MSGTGSRANDFFFRFLGNTTIPAAAVNDRCGDVDGCRIALIRVYGASRTIYGPIQFSYDTDTRQYWVLGSGGGVTGVNANVGTTTILGVAGDTNCFLSDWDTSGGFGNGDQNDNWAVVDRNTTATVMTCTLRIDD